MSPSNVSWISHSFFFSTLVIHALSKGVDLRFEGLFLLFFALSKFVPQPLLWLFLYTLPWFFHHETFFVISCVLASQAMLYSQSELKKEKRIAFLSLFYEKRLKEALLKLADTEEKLETLLLQPPAFAHEELTQLMPLSAQGYDTYLDHVEEALADKMKPISAKKKKPLKRLRRIAMTQTTFFDT